MLRNFYDSGHVRWRGHRLDCGNNLRCVALTTNSIEFHALCLEFLLMNPVLDHDPHLTKEQASVIKD